MEKVVNVIIRKGQSYIYVAAQTEDGLYVAVEPIFRSTLASDDLVNTLEQAIAFDERSVPLPRSDDEWREWHKHDFVLAATSTKNWSRLAKDSVAYTINWHEGMINLYLHALDKKGRFTSTPDRTLVFPANTPLYTIAEAILDDVHKLPELGHVDVTQPK